MTDNDKLLVESLRGGETTALGRGYAADRIEALTAEVERLRAALEDAEYALVSADRFIFQKHATRNECRTDALAAVRAALEGKQ
jgi:hypothetical protein